ncbi:MAG: hypothetical protein DSZ33_01450 [Gammaproteobacteria bacterium]|nr:MAG: hypothetical protein DSZ33_01450 [Gammaproteobacteria bacterium]
MMKIKQAETPRAQSIWRGCKLTLLLLALSGSAGASDDMTMGQIFGSLFTPPVAKTPDPRYPPIREIRFHGNRVTIPRTMLQEMQLKTGDPADPELIERSRQGIMDLGLFKRVDIKTVEEDDGVILDVTVEEKYFLLPLPTFARSADGDLSYGVNLKWDNIAGRNQSLAADFKIKDFKGAKVNKEKSFGLDYRYPRIRGSAWDINIFSNFSDESVNARDDEESVYQREATSIGFKLGRWFRKIGPSRGWFFRAGLIARHREHNLLEGKPGLFEDGSRGSYLMEIGYTEVHDHLFSRTGREFGYEMEWGHSDIGEEGDFTTNNFYYRRFTWLNDKPHHNLNYQLRAGFSSDTFFNEPTYELGGASTLRGYARDSVFGNAYLLANVVYLRPLFGHNSVRGAVFLDVGNAWPDVGDIDITDLEAGAGVGIHWKIKSFVKLQLRVDVGISANGDTKVYAGTKAPF